jgi:hypothetical protein
MAHVMKAGHSESFVLALVAILTEGLKRHASLCQSETKRDQREPVTLAFDLVS